MAQERRRVGGRSTTSIDVSHKSYHPHLDKSDRAAAEIPALPLNDVMLSDLNLKPAPKMAREMFDNSIGQVFAETKVRAELKWIAKELYTQLKLSDIYHSHVCGGRNALAFFLTAVSYQVSSSPDPEHRRASSNDTTSSLGSSTSGCSYASSRATDKGQSSEPRDLPKLNKALMMGLEHWDSLYYAVTAEIRQTYGDIQMRFNSGFANHNTVLHSYDDGSSGSQAHEQVTLVEFAQFLETTWNRITDHRFMATIDSAVRLKNLRTSVLITDGVYMDKHELLDAIAKNSGYQLQYDSAQGLIDVNRMTPSMIVAMLWQQYAPQIKKLSSHYAADISYRLRHAELREESTRGKEKEKAIRDIVRDPAAQEHACVCQAGCRCLEVCAITASFCACACRLDIRHQVLKQEESRATAHMSLDDAGLPHTPGASNYYVPSFNRMSPTTQAAFSSVAEDEDDDPNEGLFQVPLRRARQPPEIQTAKRPSHNNSPNDFLGATANELAQLQIAGLANPDPTIVYAIQVAQTAAEERDRELLVRYRSRTDSNGDGDLSEGPRSRVDSARDRDLLYGPRTPARAGKDQYPLGLYQDYSGGNRYPTREGRPIMSDETPPEQPVFGQPGAAQTKVIKRKPVPSPAPVNTQHLYDPSGSGREQVPTPPPTSPTEAEPAFDLSNTRYPSIPRSLSNRLFNADGENIGEPQQPLSTTNESFPAPAAGIGHPSPSLIQAFANWPAPDFDSPSVDSSPPVFPQRSTSKAASIEGFPPLEPTGSRPYTTVFPDLIEDPEVRAYALSAREENLQPQRPQLAQRFISAGGRYRSFEERPEVPPPPPPKEEGTFSMHKDDLFKKVARLSGDDVADGSGLSSQKRSRTQSDDSVKEKIKRFFKKD